MQVTWFEANTWLVEWAGLRLLFDPWLVGPLVFGKLDWLFKAERRQPIAELPSNLDAIVITQGLEDHCHPLTLSRLDRGIPVIASPSAAQVVRGVGLPAGDGVGAWANHDVGGKINHTSRAGSAGGADPGGKWLSFAGKPYRADVVLRTGNLGAIRAGDIHKSDGQSR